MNPTVVADLEERFRPLSEQEKRIAQALLDDAWAMLLSSVPTLEARQASGTLSDGLVRAVVSSMALRVLRNPDGIRQWSVDDASFTRDSALSAGGLYVSADEVALLSANAATPTGAFTIRPASRW